MSSLSKNIKSLAIFITIHLAGVVVQLCAAQLESNLPNFVGPYLQNPTENGVTVVFVINDLEIPELRIKNSSNDTNIPFKLDSAIIPGTKWTVWKARVENLASNTIYKYVVTYNEDFKKVSTTEYNFNIYPKNSNTLKAVFFNDLHANVKTLEALMRHCKSENYEFSALLGDCIGDAHSLEQVLLLIEKFSKLLRAHEKPMLYIRGNHECRGNFAKHLGYFFDLPKLEPSAGLGGKFYFTLDMGPIWFLALDCGEDFEKKIELMEPYREQQAEWLRALQESNPRKTKPWRVAISHIPLYNNNIWNSEPARMRWEPTIKNMNLDCYLAGHDHSFKVLDKNRTFQVEHDPKYTKNKGKWEMTTPCPIMIGGGPDHKTATMMLLEANLDRLHILALNTSGSRVGELDLKK